MTAALTFDPVRLAEYTFNHSHWETPAAILRQLFQPHSKVAVKSCHASGKTFVAADAVLLTLLLGGDVITTAPTDDQVEGQIWRSVHRAIDDGRLPRTEWGHITLKEIKLPSGERAFGRSTNQGVRFQGEHSRPGSFLTIVTDEAPGLLGEIYDAIEGIRAGGDIRLLFLGNPVIPSGPFYDIFAGDRIGWDRHTISAFETPNMMGLTLEDVLSMSTAELDDNVRPYLITRRYVYEKWHEWGPDNPNFQSRVLGNFPDQATNSLISLAWLEAARARPGVWAENGGAVAAGVDVAGPGKDETVVCIRQGTRVLGVYPFGDADSRGRVLQILQHWLHRGLRVVNVDSAGDGHYFTQHLKDHLPAVVEVHGINVGSSPTDVLGNDGRSAKDVFANLKAELYWHLRMQFRDGMVAGLTDQTTISQLASILWAPNSKGKTEIESKEKAAKRGVKSPDRAEALMLAFAPRLQDQMLARAWEGQVANVLTADEQRMPWNSPAERPGAPWAAQSPGKQQRWLEGTNWT